MKPADRRTESQQRQQTLCCHLGFIMSENWLRLQIPQSLNSCKLQIISWDPELLWSPPVGLLSPPGKPGKNWNANWSSQRDSLKGSARSISSPVTHPTHTAGFALQLQSHSWWEAAVLTQISAFLPQTEHLRWRHWHPQHPRVKRGCSQHSPAHTQPSRPKAQQDGGWTHLAALRYISRSQSLTPGIHTSSSCCVTVSPSGDGNGCRSGSLAWKRGSHRHGTCSWCQEDTQVRKFSGTVGSGRWKMFRQRVVKGFVPSFRTLRTLRHHAPTPFPLSAFLPQKGSDCPDDHSGLTPPQPTASAVFMFTGTAELERKAFCTAQPPRFGSPELMDNSPSEEFLTGMLIQAETLTKHTHMKEGRVTMCVPSEISKKPYTFDTKFKIKCPVNH